MSEFPNECSLALVILVHQRNHISWSKAKLSFEAALIEFHLFHLGPGPQGFPPQHWPRQLGLPQRPLGTTPRRHGGRPKMFEEAKVKRTSAQPGWFGFNVGNVFDVDMTQLSGNWHGTEQQLRNVIQLPIFGGFHVRSSAFCSACHRPASGWCVHPKPDFNTIEGHRAQQSSRKDPHRQTSRNIHTFPRKCQQIIKYSPAVSWYLRDSDGKSPLKKLGHAKVMVVPSQLSDFFVLLGAPEDDKILFVSV